MHSGYKNEGIDFYFGDVSLDTDEFCLLRLIGLF